MSNRQTAHGDAKSPAELVGLGGLFRSRGVKRDTASQPYAPPPARWDPYTHLPYRSCQEHDKRVDALLKLPPEALRWVMESGDLRTSLLP